MNERKEIIEELNSLRKESRNLYSLYFLGTPLPMGKQKFYLGKGWVRRKLLEEMRWTVKDKSKTEEIVDELEKQGIVEYRRLGDLSPTFPYNVKNITEEQAKKFRNMLDADDEMCNFALTIIDELQKKKEGELV